MNKEELKEMGKQLKEILDKYPNKQKEILFYIFGEDTIREIIGKPTYEELQQKVNQLETKINVYENPDDMTLMFMWCDEKAKDKIKQLQQKINQLEEKEELHLNRIDELIDEIVKLKTNRKKAIKLLKRGTAFCKNDSYGGYEVCKIAIKRESEVIKILKGDSNE